MRKMMSREITKTTIKVAKMETVDGLPKAVPLEDITVLGNVSQEKAQKIANKHYEESVSVFQVIPETTVYELEVEEFMKIASVKEPVTAE